MGEPSRRTIGRGSGGCGGEGRTSMIWAAVVCCFAIRSAAAVDYILARRTSSVESICLGTNPGFAFAWDSRILGARPLPAFDLATINWSSGSTVSSAKYIYIGSIDDTISHYCAQQVDFILFRPPNTVSTTSTTAVNTASVAVKAAAQALTNPGPPTIPTFLRLDALPGSAGAIAYAAPIWTANSTADVSFTLANSAEDELWEVVSSLPYDPLVPGSSYLDAQLSGSFYNASFSTVEMVAAYIGAALTSPDYSTYQTYGAAILNSLDGSVAYLFFMIFPGTSSKCANLRQQGRFCVLAHLFQAQYDVSDVNFTDIYSAAAAAAAAAGGSSVTAGYGRSLLEGNDHEASAGSSGTDVGGRRVERSLVDPEGHSGTMRHGFNSLPRRHMTVKLDEKHRRLAGVSVGTAAGPTVGGVTTRRLQQVTKKRYVRSRTYAGAQVRVRCVVIVPRPMWCTTDKPTYPRCLMLCY